MLPSGLLPSGLLPSGLLLGRAAMPAPEGDPRYRLVARARPSVDYTDPRVVRLIESLDSVYQDFLR